MPAPEGEETDVDDPVVTRMPCLPATVVSTSLTEPLNWRYATVRATTGSTCTAGAAAEDRPGQE